MPTLTGYRIMWMLVMFDLPVGTKVERKGATKFRKYLLDQGFEMSQFSVYLRFCSGKEHTARLTRDIQGHLPKGGQVDILCFTDKQYENIISFRGRTRQPDRRNPEQFVLL